MHYSRQILLFDSIDTLLFSAIGLSNVVGTWTNATNYSISERVFDPDDATLWNCLVNHASAPTGTFSQDRQLHPANWNSVGSLPFVRGQWTNDTVYAPGDFAYDSTESLVGVCNTFHTSSSPPNTMRNNIGVWDILADLSATNVVVSSVNAQIGAVVLDADDIDDTLTIQKFASASQLAQIADHESRLDVIEPIVANHASRIAALEGAGAGLNKAAIWQVGMLLPWTSATPPTTKNDNGLTPAWLLCKGGTIGTNASGASLRSDLDMLPLFTHLWTNFANSELTIQTGAGVPTVRGADASTDFNANKRMPVPDCRGGVFYFADSGKGAISVTGHSTSGARIGGQAVSLTPAHIPANLPFTQTFTFTGDALPSHNHTYLRYNKLEQNVDLSGVADNFWRASNDVTGDGQNTGGKSAGTPTGTVTSTLAINPTGGTLAIPTITPGIVMPTAIIKT